MTSTTHTGRLPRNVPGKYYVSNQCIDCDFCREVAPEILARNAEDGTSYVKRQPASVQEEQRCREAMDGCGVGAIRVTEDA